MNGNPCTAAGIFIMSAFVGILEPSPSAYIENQNSLVMGLPALDIGEHAGELAPSLDVESAFAFVGIDNDNFHVAACGILPDRIHLIARGVLLVFRGHADISRGTYNGWYPWGWSCCWCVHGYWKNWKRVTSGAGLEQ